MSLLQREMLSTFKTLEGLTRGPRVLDVDDAIWLRRDGRFAAQIARSCECVICGNSFLADAFREWNPKVRVLPTAVDTTVFSPAVGEPREPRRRCIGWSGTSSGLAYLRSIEEPLAVVMRARPDVELLVVCDQPPRLSSLPAGRMRFVQWSPQIEAQETRRMSVGIMPLDDSLFARGKCSFKMLTYMASGVPVVVSPVGMNADVLARGSVGLAARAADEWTAALIFLLDESEMARRMGAAGRQVVESHYSVDRLAPELSRILRSTFAEARFPESSAVPT